MSYQGKPVKASRLFAGYEHEQQVKRLAAHFNKPLEYYSGVTFDPSLVSAAGTVSGIRPGGAAGQSEAGADSGLQPGIAAGQSQGLQLSASAFPERRLSSFATYEEAYHRLLMDIMDQQVVSTQLVLEGTDIKRIFVDGGFGRNQVYMHLLATAFPHIEVFAASIPQASAIGAAQAIHRHWNTRALPGDIIELKYYK
jgi:hypothetical protein